MKHLILALSMMFSFSAYADSLILGQKTHHFKKYQARDKPAFVEDRVLIGWSNDKYTVVAMDQNSYGNTSVVAVRTFKYELNKYMRPYVAVGIATGYDNEIPEVSMLGLTPAYYFGLDLHLANDKVGILTTVNNSFIGLGLRIKIN